RLDEHFRERGADRAVEIDGDVAVGSGRLAERAERGGDFAHEGRRLDEARGAQLRRPALERGEALGLFLLDQLRLAGVGVDAAPRGVARKVRGSAIVSGSGTRSS